MSFHLTFDLDWAPDFMIDDLVNLVRRSGVRATFFCTHQSPGVERLTSLPGCETALHPNLLREGQDESTILADLHQLFPHAVGIRNHRLSYHSGLLETFHQRKLCYFSNDLLFLQPDLRPFYDWSGIVRLPIYWEDDVHCLFFEQQFDLTLLALDRPGMKVFNFHPVHLWLNTARLDDYQRAKPAIQCEDRATAFRNGGKGIRSLFLSLIDAIGDRPTPTLADVAAEYVSGTPFHGATKDAFDRSAGQ